MKEHIKVFSGGSIIANRLAFLLDKEGIATLIKDNRESARLAGFGNLGTSVDVFIYKADIEKAQPVIDSFEKEIEK